MKETPITGVSCASDFVFDKPSTLVSGACFQSRLADCGAIRTAACRHPAPQNTTVILWWELSFLL